MYDAGPAEHHQARELTDPSGRPTGRWVYACQQDDRVRPIGYCSLACSHENKEAAEEHYRDYLLDEATYDGRWRGVEYRCEVCGEWTDRFAQTKAFAIYRLCPTHLNHDGLRRLLAGPPAEWRVEIE